MSSKSVSRRNFLKAAGITLAATSVTCVGLSYAATLSPAKTPLDVSFGKENSMNKKILITYATRAGSTAEVAAAIGESLAGRGFMVDVKSIKDKPVLDGYQGVIVGSVIRMGNWVSEAVDFVKNNQATLAGLPVAIFSVHGANTGDDPESQAAREDYVKKVTGLLPAAETAFFAGKMDFSKLSFFDRTIVKMMGSPEEDKRDWNKIKAWGQAVFA